MAEIFLARHGETDWNRDGIWQGHGDPPLNALGRRQAEGLARRLSGLHIEVVYSSDLRRALETAKILASALGLDVVAEPGLREIDIGSWTGLTRQEIEERYPGGQGHDGEPFDAFQARAVAAVESVATAHSGRRVLVVTHGGVIRAVQRHALGEPAPLLGNCGTCLFAFRDGRFSALD